MANAMVTMAAAVKIGYHPPLASTNSSTLSTRTCHEQVTTTLKESKILRVLKCFFNCSKGMLCNIIQIKASLLVQLHLKSHPLKNRMGHS